MKVYLSAGLLSILIFMSSTIVLTTTVRAQVDPACDKSSSFLGLPPWYKYLKVEKDASGCKVTLAPKGTQVDWGSVGGRILLAVFEILLRISSLAAIAFVMWGGIQYQLSQGEPDRVNKARSIILNALIGLALAISASVIVNLVARNIA